MAVSGQREARGRGVDGRLAMQASEGGMASVLSRSAGMRVRRRDPPRTPGARDHGVYEGVANRGRAGDAQKSSHPATSGHQRIVRCYGSAWRPVVRRPGFADERLQDLAVGRNVLQRPVLDRPPGDKVADLLTVVHLLEDRAQRVDGRLHLARPRSGIEAGLELRAERGRFCRGGASRSKQPSRFPAQLDFGVTRA